MGNEADKLIAETEPTYLPQSIVNNLQRTDYHYESQFIQRVKLTPFINCEVLVVSPSDVRSPPVGRQQQKRQRVIFVDRVDIPVSQLIGPRTASLSQSSLSSLKAKSHFPKEEVVKILHCVSEALYQLTQKYNYGPAYGDITLDTIYYSKQSKAFKLLNPAFVVQSGYTFAFHGKRFSLLAPQQLLGLSELPNTKYRQTPQKDNKSYLSDVFTLALVILQICTLTPSSEIYCPQTYNIFDSEIINRLNITENLYGKQLRTTLERMLEYEADLRITPPQLVIIVREMRGRELH